MAVQHNALHILVVAAIIMGYHLERLAIFQMNGRLVEQRASDGIYRLAGAYLIEAHRIQYVPCRHLSAVFIARKSVGVVEVKRMQHLIHNLLRTPGLAYVVVEMGNVMARLIAVGILAYQTGNIHRGRFTFQLGKSAVNRESQLADEGVASSHQFHQSVYIVGERTKSTAKQYLRNSHRYGDWMRGG